MKKKKVLFLLALTAVLSFSGCNRAENKEQQNLVIDTRAEMASDKAVKNDLSQRMVYFSGISDAIITKETVVFLDNMPENEDFMMTYSIYKDDKEVFATDLIPSGKQVEWKPYEVLGEGIHTLTIREIPYFNQDGNYIPLTYGENTVVFTVQ